MKPTRQHNSGPKWGARAPRPQFPAPSPETSATGSAHQAGKHWRVRPTGEGAGGQGPGRACSPIRPHRSGFSRGSLLHLATLSALLCLSCWPLRAASPDSALDAYEKRDFPRARAEFEQLAKKDPADPRLRFNAGDAAYRMRDFTNAAAHFESVLAAPDLKLQQGAYYNLGNARYLLGETTRDPQAKLQAWQQSLTNFSSAVKLDPKDTNAASNFAYLKQRVEELLKQMPQQQQPQKGDQDKDKKDPKDDQDQSQQGQQKPSPGDQPKDQQQAQKPEQQPDQGKDGKPEDQKSQQTKADQKKDEQQRQAEEQKARQQAGKEPGKEGSGDGEPTAAEEAGKPGEMSPVQAARLLDNQKGEEKALVFQSANGKGSRERPQRIRKPW